MTSTMYIASLLQVWITEVSTAAIYICRDGYVYYRMVMCVAL